MAKKTVTTCDLCNKRGQLLQFTYDTYRDDGCESFDDSDPVPSGLGTGRLRLCHRCSVRMGEIVWDAYLASEERENLVAYYVNSSKWRPPA